MTASRVASSAAVGDAHAKGDADPIRVDLGNELEDADAAEVIPLRVEPLPQQSAAPVDVERGLRLIQSCRDGDFAAVQRQIAEGAPAGFVTKTGWTPLAAAAFGGRSDIVRHLLELGADGMYTKSTKRFASSHAPQSSMAANGGFGGGGGGGDSTASLGSVDKSASSHQLDTAASPPPLTSNGSNGSIDGTRNGDASTAVSAKKLLGNGSNTPLHWACYRGHAEIVTILLHAGYGLEDTDPIGNRALHLACSGGFRDVVEILLANSAAVDQRNRYGNRPLDLATDPACRKLLLKFQAQTSCEWCKESFSRLRRASLCQHCHNVYCDVKPCSSVTEIVTPVDYSRPGTASTSAVVRALRYCQECATEMGKTEQDLRTILDAKLELIRNTVEMIARASTPAEPSSGRGSTVGGSRPVTASAPASGSAESNGDHGDAAADGISAESIGVDVGDGGVVVPLSSGGGGDMDGVEPPPGVAELEPRRPTRRLLTNDEISRTLSLSQTDAEALYTSIEAAQLKAVDRGLVLRAKQTYRQFVAHVALQEEIKSLMVVRPIGVRSLIEPLKAALLNARRADVSHEMLMLGVQVVRGAEAECTLFGCEAMCAKIELGTQKHRRDIARLEASVRESQAVGVNDKLLALAVALRDRLNAEVQLQACLQPFTPLSTTDAAGVETVLGYRFEDGAEVATLLQALELRNAKIQAAVETGSTVEGVSAALLEDGANVLKQLKKDIKEEAKNEEERRRLEEEAALKAAKKGKKKKKA